MFSSEGSQGIINHKYFFLSQRKCGFVAQTQRIPPPNSCICASCKHVLCTDQVPGRGQDGAGVHTTQMWSPGRSQGDGKADVPGDTDSNCTRPWGAQGSHETPQEDHHRPPRRRCWARVLEGGTEVGACWRGEGGPKGAERRCSGRQALDCSFTLPPLAEPLLPGSPCCSAGHGQQGKGPFSALQSSSGGAQRGSSAGRVSRALSH